MNDKKFYSHEASDIAMREWATQHGLAEASKNPEWFKFDMQHEIQSVYDHASFWKIKGSRKQAADVLILQPYGLSIEGMSELTTFAKCHDVDTQVLDGSWWTPGGTVMISLTKTNIQLTLKPALWQEHYYN